MQIRWAHSALNIQCKSRQVRLIDIGYSVVILIKWAYSDSIFNAGPDKLERLNGQKVGKLERLKGRNGWKVGMV
jgi:hypothetical protein